MCFRCAIVFTCVVMERERETERRVACGEQRVGEVGKGGEWSGSED